MINENCMDCMYSEHSESSMMINDLMDIEYAICNHQNSPFCGKLINDNQTCRLFLDANKYFLRKDRKDKLDELNKKIK